MPTSRLAVFAHLSQMLAPLDPAELHGLLCGLLSADPHLDRDRWLRHATELLDEDAELTDTARDLLSKLFEYGLAQLNTEERMIAPLLPDDETSLEQRTAALGAWCQGLLYGLGLGQVDRQGLLSEESQEFLRDAVEIARIGFETDEDSEVDEIAYAEVVEYLRAGLLLLQEDLPHRPQTSRLH
jgi:yecA family protein